MQDLKLVKDLAFGDHARSQVLTGVEKLTNAVGSTLGASGSHTGDPSEGCHIGHGSTEGSHEGWYANSGGAYDSQGYTTWIR